MSREKPPPSNMTSSVENKLKDLKIQKTDINILLLGETGVGKSTLINAFANYLTYSDLKKAKKDKLLVLIPTQFRAKDKNNEYHIINTGQSDKNETIETGESATQDVKTYVFPIWNGQIKVRLIDTPGMGDTKGIEQDNINSENILSYIGNLHELHAICFLLKPNEPRITAFFQYCMKQILTRLDKTASDNIIFCFTNTRGTDYSPGETMGTLKKLVVDIGNKPPYAKIPLNRNIFCFDNEPFRYLAAVESSVEFDHDIRDKNKISWEKSASQCWKLIHYITGDKDNHPLKPHFVKSTTAVNEARRIINQLAQPLAEITQLIHHNLSVLERHKDNLTLDRGSLEDMKKKLYMPVIALDVIMMTQPITVCTARKCIDVYQVAGKSITDYKQRCHDPCYLNNVPKEIIGSPELMNCAAMNGTTACRICFCDYRVHMHVYYKTKTKEIQERDENMQMNITSREELMRNREKMMKNLETKMNELDSEHHVIVETTAKFAHFLQNNALTPFNDHYKDYIEYLINREQLLGKLCDADTVNHLKKLLNQYTELKHRFDEALKSHKAIGRDDIVTPKDINDSIQKLYKLKHNGKKIKELYDCQKKSRNKEHQNTEYLHKISVKKEEKKEKGTKDKNEKKDKEKEKSKTQTKSKTETQRSRPVSPPPSYQESHRSRNYPPPPRGQYPQGAPRYPQGNPQYPQGVPQYNQHPQRPPGPQNPQYPPYSGPYRYGHDYHRGPEGEHPEYDINITLKKASDTHPSTHQPPHPSNYPPHNYPSSSHGGSYYPPQQGYHPPPPQGYPPPSPGYHPPSQGYYPPPPPSPGYHQPPQGYHPPPHQDYPPNQYGQTYDSHHGVNRQNSGGSQQGNFNRGNDQTRGGFKGGRGRGGGVHKKNRSKKGKNENEEKREKKEKKKNKKNKKEKKSSDSDSDSSDSSSS